MWLLEYGKDNYWTGGKMVEHAVRVALQVPTFRYAFPNCQALFAFDNTPKHCSFSKDALVAKRMNLNPRGQRRSCEMVLTISMAYHKLWSSPDI